LVGVVCSTRPASPPRILSTDLDLTLDRGAQKTFAQKDIFPERQLTRYNLIRNTFSQKYILSEIQLPKR
jgi:hypothetical protein